MIRQQEEKFLNENKNELDVEKEEDVESLDITVDEDVDYDVLEYV